MRAIALIVFCAASLACKGGSPEAKRDEPAPSPSTSKKAVFARYASSTTGEPLVVEGPEIFMDMTGIRIGNGPVLVPLTGDGVAGFAAEHKTRGTQTDLELRALTAALEKLTKPESTVATFHVDPRVTYRMMTELMFTSGQSGFAKCRFVVVEGASEVKRAITLDLPKPRKASGTAKTLSSASAAAAAKTLSDELDALEMKALGSIGTDAGGPSSSPPPKPPTPSPPTPFPPPTLVVCGSAPLSLTVIVSSLGFYVKAMGASIVPGCAGGSSSGGGPTVPLLSERYDYPALRACVVKLHDCHPSYATDATVMVTMNPSIDFQTLVSTWDAVRRRADGKPLMPDILLTVLK